jgi:hypothetical protein
MLRCAAATVQAVAPHLAADPVVGTRGDPIFDPRLVIVGESSAALCAASLSEGSSDMEASRAFSISGAGPAESWP